MNKRRKLVVAFGAGALAAPLASFAQQPSKVWRVGFLGAESEARYSSRVDAIRAGLRDLGYVDGKNVSFGFRWAEGKADRLADLAAELVHSGVDIIITHGTPATLAAKRATTTIPILMAISGDAVATGIVTSLARPSGNVTGSTFFSPELAAKRLELLKELIPRVSQVAVLVNPNTPTVDPILHVMGKTAAHLKVTLHPYAVRAPSEFDEAFEAMVKKGMGAVVIPESTMFIANVGTIAAITLTKRIPSAGLVEFAEAGGLIAYGINQLETWRRASYFADKIFKGTRPANLPVELPTKFELAINMKTAKALGLTIPPSVMVRATRVIE